MAASSLLNRVDEAIGSGLERSIRAHHGRRLARRGHAARSIRRPAAGRRTGRSRRVAGSKVDLLVDGAEALPRMVEDIRAASSHVHVAGWFFTPSFRMGEGGPTLRELLADAAQRVDVRVLAWAGAPLPLFHPDRGEVRDVRDALTRGTRVQMQLDARERPMHCHHEKLVLVDDRVAYVGGIDLTSLAGDRLDSSLHERRPGLGWHDASLRLEGPIVADVAEHYRLRWQGRLPGPSELAPAGGLEAQLVRTVPERIYDGLPRGEFTILESYLRALRSAERLVYLESQFLWSPELTGVLADKLRDPPHPDFRVVVVLPAKPNNGSDDTRGQLGVLVAAAKEGGDDGRFLACTLFQPGGTLRVRAREDRHRRRHVDDSRLREPQRALALQRHRGERRPPRRAVHPRRAAATVGGASRAARRRRSFPRRRRAVAPARARSQRTIASCVCCTASPAARSP